MIYLFNKVFLVPDAFYNTPVSRFIYTNLDGELADNTLVQEQFGPVIKQGALDNMNQEFKLWWNADATKRTYVHISNEDMLTVVIAWYKTLLINCSPDVAYLVVKMVYDRFEAVYGTPHNPNMFQTSRDIEAVTTLAASFVDKEEFIQRWSAAVPIDLNEIGITRDQLLSQAPVEFLIASQYTKPDHDYAALKEKVVRMVKTWQIGMSIDMKNMSLQRLSLLPDFDPTTDILAEWVASKHPEYRMLVDSDYNNKNVDYILNSYDMTEIRDVYVSQMKRFEYIDVEDRVNEFKMFDPSITYEDIMNIELAHKFSRVQLGWWQYQNSINGFILDLVLNMIRSGDKRLAELSVL